MINIEGNQKKEDLIKNIKKHIEKAKETAKANNRDSITDFESSSTSSEDSDGAEDLEARYTLQISGETMSHCLLDAELCGTIKPLIM